MNAIFVDGVGRVRHRQAEGEPLVVIPVPRRIGVSIPKAGTVDPSLARQTAAFKYLGTLRDGRLVYGQVDAKLTIWRWQWSVAPTPENPRENIVIQLQQLLDEWIRHRTSEPCRVLASEERQLSDGQIMRFVEGVARPRESESANG